MTNREWLNRQPDKTFVGFVEFVDRNNTHVMNCEDCVLKENCYHYLWSREATCPDCTVGYKEVVK